MPRNSDDAALLALAIDRAPRLRCDEKHLLFERLDGLKELAVLSFSCLQSAIGRGFRPGLEWNPEALVKRAERDLVLMERMGMRFTRLGRPDYPAALAETSRPPFVLYYRGALPDPYEPAVAIVGTRYPTNRGISEAVALATDATARGMQVVSGLARGIDAAAHAGAVEAGGATFAVLGCGADRMYPQRNRALAARILGSGGGILSEYPPGVEPAAFRFPERNRIIAGLCRATVVVEAPEDSGALITAQFALDEGREVRVSGRCLGGPRSAGCAALANDGAETADDFSFECGGFWRDSECATDYLALRAYRRPLFGDGAHVVSHNAVYQGSGR